MIFQPKNEAFEELLLQTISLCTSTPLNKEELGKILKIAETHSPKQNIVLLDEKKEGLSRSLLLGPEKSFLLMTHKGDTQVGRGQTKTAYFAIDLLKAKQKIVLLARKNTCSSLKWLALKNEIVMMAKLQGIPEIIQVDLALMTDSECYFIEEYCNHGDLLSAITRRMLDAKQSLFIAIDIANGLRKMHALGILHRDVKPQNIFLIQDQEQPLKAKIADLGSSCMVDDEDSLQKLYGSALWFSPEKSKILLSPRSQEEKIPDWIRTSTDKVDIWSLGCLFFILFQGGILNWQLGFHDQEESREVVERCAKLQQKDLTDEIRHSYLLPPFMPLIEGMLQIDPHKRFTSEDVYEKLLEIAAHYKVSTEDRS